MGLRRFVDALLGLDKVAPAPVADLQRWQSVLLSGTRQRQQGQYEEALRTFEGVVEEARAAGNRVAEATALGHLGALHTERRQWAAAGEALDRALAIAREQHNPVLLAAVLNDRAHFLQAKGERQTAQETFEEALVYARQGTDSTLTAHILAELSDIYLDDSNASYAYRLLEEANQLTHHQVPAFVGRLGKAAVAVGREVEGHRWIVQALRLSHALGNSEQEIQWAMTLAQRYATQGRLDEAERLYQRAAVLLKSGLRLKPAEQVCYLLQRADISYQLGRYAEAARFAEQAIPLAEDLGLTAEIARAHGLLGMASRASGQHDQAIGHLQTALGYLSREVPASGRFELQLELARVQQEIAPEEALATYRKIVSEAREGGEKEALARALTYLGRLEHNRGQTQTALDAWREAASLFEELGDSHFLAPLLCDIANLLKDRGDVKQALTLYEQALVALNHVKHAPTRGLVLSNVANMYVETGDVQTAEAFYQEAITIARTSGDRLAESLRLGNLGWFYMLIGRQHDAVSSLERALQLSDGLGVPLVQAVQRNNLAQAQARLGDFAGAERSHQQALRSLEGLGEKRWEGVLHSDLGETLARQRKFQEARAHYEQALSLSREAGDNTTQARTLWRLGDLQRETGDVAAAEASYEQAAQKAQAISAQRDLAHAYLGHGLLALSRQQHDRARTLLQEAVRLFGILHAPEQKIAEQAYSRLT